MRPPDVRLTERFEHSTLPMAMLTLEGRLFEVNRSLCRLLDLSAAELVGTLATELATGPDDRCAAARALQEAGSGTVGGEFTQTWSKAGDTASPQIYVRVAWSMMRDRSGEPWYISVTCIDESVRVMAERQRDLEAARWRGRFEQSTVPQLQCDLQGRVADVNQAFCDMLGMQPGDLCGRLVVQLVHASDRGPGQLALERLLAGEVSSYQVERVLADAVGRPVPVLVNASIIRDGSGAPESAAAYFQDLSALRTAERRQEQQESFFLALSARAGDLAVVIGVGGELTYVSPSFTAVLGHDVLDVVGQTAWGLLHPDDAPAVGHRFRLLLEQGGTQELDVRVRTAAGGWRLMESSMTNLVDTSVGGIVCNLKDITERRQAEAAGRDSEARLRTIVDTAEEGIWAAAPDGSVLYVNARLDGVLGLERGEASTATGHVWSRFSERDLEARVMGAMTREQVEVSYAHPDGQQRVLAVTMSPLLGADGAREGSLAMITDVTDSRRLESDLRHAALHDSLTGLPNRALLVDRLEHALALGVGRTAVLFVDLDDFKVVNDSRGHGSGDELLVAVAERLRCAVRARDTVARFGGDEFVVVCEAVDDRTAQELAAGLLAALTAPFPLAGASVHVGASIGVALSPAGSAGDLLRFADAAMYAAKRAGRRQVKLFDPALVQDVEQRFALTADLHEALSQDALSMHYQPIVDLRSGEVLGVEALARWQHPVHGAVPPDRFVPLAEDTGLAHDLNRWAVRRACRDVAELRRAGALPSTAYVAVNLSARRLADTDLVDLLLATTAEVGIPPELVVLEITETTLMDDLAVTVPVLADLRERGFRVAVDDFGTGYSSLSYLRDLPLSILKIDRGFVVGIDTDPDALAIVASLVDLAAAVGLAVVAEGVETQQQADLLLRLGCPAAQGWLWSRAVTTGEATGQGSLLGPFAPGRREGAAGPSRDPGAARAWSADQVRPGHGWDRMLELHREGASLQTIAAALNQAGYLTPAQARWSRTAVARCLSARAYPELSL